MTDQPKDDAKKIIVDDDWKAQAQAEKERLAAEEAEKKAQAPDSEDAHMQMPEASLLVLINSLAMQAMYALGGMQDPETKQAIVDLGLAKFNIDLLDVLKEKTQGNRDEEESKLLEQASAELKMAFAQICQHIAQQQAGGMMPGGAGAPKIETN